MRVPVNRFTDLLAQPGPLRLVGVLIAALASGLGAGYYLSRHAPAQSDKSDAPIEWNQVQAVPARAPDAEDNEWQERADVLDEPSDQRRGAARNEAQ